MSLKAFQADEILHIVLIEFRFLLKIAITVVIVGKVRDPAQFSLHDVALYVTDIEVIVTVGIEGQERLLLVMGTDSVLISK